MTYPLEGLLAVTPPDRRPQEFEFDHVFGPETTQQVMMMMMSVDACLGPVWGLCIFQLRPARAAQNSLPCTPWRLR